MLMAVSFAGETRGVLTMLNSGSERFEELHEHRFVQVALNEAHKTAERLGINAANAAQKLMDTCVTYAQAAVASTLSALAEAPAYGTLTLLLLFFLLADGRRVVPHLRVLLPIPPPMTQELCTDLQRIATAAVLGNVVTALSQGLVVGLGVWAVDLPFPLLCTVAATFASFVPVAGSALVWLPLVAALAGQSGWAPAVALFAWCSAGSALNTNVVKPYVVGHRLPMHNMVTFLSILGGVKLLGMLGVIAGPLCVGLCWSILKLYRRARAAEARALFSFSPGKEAFSN